MMRHALFVVVALAGSALSCRTAAPPAPPAPVAPLEPPQPTLRLPRNFVPTGYEATLGIDPTQLRFDGAIAIHGDVAARSSVIWLHGRDLTIASASASGGGRTVELTVTPRGEDLLELRAASPLDPGPWTLALRYQGTLLEHESAGAFRQLVGGDAYVFTQLEAIHARQVFPCFDEPDVKVPWQLTLEVPSALVAVANTPSTSETAIDGGRRRIAFARSLPLPSYLVAFAVGPFDIVDGGRTRTGVPMRMLTLKGRAADAAFAVATTPRIVAILEDWFVTPYPYEKLDQITIPLTSGFGAMENAGLITYVESLLLMDPEDASWQQRHDWVATAGHELAHQWFGNLVTTAWWDDLWLNEGFATWMEEKVLTELEPSWRDELTRSELRRFALQSDRLTTARRIRQPIERTDDIVNAFDNITYSKGAAVLAMFEQAIGPAAFQRGVRAYLAKHAWGNATSTDFFAAISEVANRDVGVELATFLDQAGAPRVAFDLRCVDSRPILALQQQRYLPPGAAAPTGPAPIWSIPLCVAFERDGGRAEQCVTFATPQLDVALDAPRCPRWLMPNVGGHGYYRAVLPAAASAAIRDLAWPQLTTVERLVVFNDVRDQAEVGELPLGDVMPYIPKLAAEQHRFALAAAIGLIWSLRYQVPEPQLAAFEAWVRTTFGATATRLGWLPRPSDTMDDEAVRRGVVWLVAAMHDGPLRAQAVTQARTWRDLAPAMRGAILDVAADESPERFRQLLADLATTTDGTARNQLLAALGATTRAELQREALALTLDTRLDLIETSDLLYSGRYDPQEDVARAFFREHQDALLARMPTNFGAKARLAHIFAVCEAARRDDAAAYMRATFASFEGGARTVSQAIERMDQCIARKAVMAPQLARWLAAAARP